MYHQGHDIYFRDRVRQQRAAQGLPPLAGFETELPVAQTLQALYEFTRDQILARARTPFPYLLKVDGDHIYDAQIIQQQLDFLARAPERVHFFGLPKFNLYYSRTRDQLFFRSVAALDDHFIMLVPTLHFTSYCEDKYDINGKLIHAQAQAYEAMIPFKPQSNPLVKWWRKHFTRPQPSHTPEYLRSLLPLHGAALHTMLGQPPRCVENEFYVFTPEQVHAAYDPQLQHLLREPQANGFPPELQERFQPACTLGQITPLNCAPLYSRIQEAHAQLANQSEYPLTHWRHRAHEWQDLRSYANLPWYNSAHFFLQKHVARSHPQNADLSDDELITYQLVPFSLFRESALFAELQVRFPHFNAHDLLHNEEQLLQIARRFDYREWEK